MRVAVVCALTAVLLLVAATPPAQAQNPIQLAIFNPAQIVKDSEPVNGVRLNLIYTKNTSMTGLDLGFIYNENTGYGVLYILTVHHVFSKPAGARWYPKRNHSNTVR